MSAVFEMRLEGPAPAEDGRLRGRMTLGDFEEGFRACIREWTSADYDRHWRSTARELSREPKPFCFAASIDSTGIDAWIAMPAGDSVLFVNGLLFRSDVVQIGPLLEPKPLVLAVAERPDGLSTWNVPLSAIHAFGRQG